MTIREQIRQIESVEQLFAILNVPYDAKVVAVHRMRILRRFGRQMEALELSHASANEAEFQGLCAEALRQINLECARGMREPEPVFRGLGQQLIQLRRPFAR